MPKTGSCYLEHLLQILEDQKARIIMECNKRFPDSDFGFINDVKLAGKDDPEAAEGKDIVDADSGNILAQ